MGKRNELPALVVSLLITIALLGGGAWWLKGKLLGNGGIFAPETGQSGEVADSGSNGSIDTAGADGSAGKSILPEVVSSAKQNGLNALAAGDYATAETEFAAALKEKRNDPEALIYLNNAKIGEAKAYTLAVSIPSNAEFLGPALEILRGVAQAQQDLNSAGGIQGTPIKVLVLNDKGSPEISKTVAAELVADKDVLGVVGHYSSNMTLAAAEVYEAGKLAMISPTSTAVNISNAGDYIFRTVPSDRLAAAALARHVLTGLKKTQAVVFYTGASAYSQSVQSEFTTELLSNGGQVVADFDIDAPDFSAGQALQSAKQAGAEVIMLALTEDTEETSLQILSVNQQNLPMVGGDSLYDFNILDVGREDAVGLTVAVPWHILSYQQSPFVKTSQQLWGAAVNWRTATAYDALKALAAAIETGGADREGIKTALSSPSFNTAGATNPVRFFPTGDRNQPAQLVTVVKKETNSISGTGYDYVPQK